MSDFALPETLDGNDRISLSISLAFFPHKKKVPQPSGETAEDGLDNPVRPLIGGIKDSRRSTGQILGRKVRDSLVVVVESGIDRKSVIVQSTPCQPQVATPLLVALLVLLVESGRSLAC